MNRLWRKSALANNSSKLTSNSPQSDPPTLAQIVPPGRNAVTIIFIRDIETTDINHPRIADQQFAVISNA
jgi:hypothetical protein